jgi:hypothetical protein
MDRGEKLLVIDIREESEYATKAIATPGRGKLAIRNRGELPNTQR